MKKSRRQNKRVRTSENPRQSPFLLNISVVGTLLPIACFAVLGFLIYSNTLEAPFAFDDIKTITENSSIRIQELTVNNIIDAAFGLSKNRPFPKLSFAFNYYFGHYRPAGYHLVNIIIHIINGILLFFFLRQTFIIIKPQGSFKPKSTFSHVYWISFFAALIWLAHPIQTQSVTYIVQRMNSMAATPFLLSLLLYSKGRISRSKALDDSATGNDKAMRKRFLRISYLWFLGCGLSGIFALGSKENAATLPLIIFFYEWYFFQDLSPKWFKSSLKYMIAAAIIFAAVAFLYLGTDPLEKINRLRDFSHGEFTLAQRALTQTRVVIYYLSLIFFPHPSRLNLDYNFPLSYSLFNPVTTLLSLVFIIGLMALAFYLAKRERLISFCILWFLGNLVIESSIIPLAIIFEHRTYLPSMMVWLVPVLLGDRFIRMGGLKIGLACAVIVVFSLWTFKRNQVWQSEFSLWGDVVKKSPNKARPNNNLGIARANQGLIDDAVVHYQKALQADPDYYQAHVNWGKALEEKGMLTEAAEHYRTALTIKPNFAEAHNNLGAVLLKQGKTGEAIDILLKTLKIKPENERAHFNLGDAFVEQGRLPQAIEHYQMALHINPGLAMAHNNLGGVYMKQGWIEKALNHYTAALSLDPELVEAYNNLGIALMQTGKIEAGIDAFQKALQLSPTFTMAENNLKRAQAIWKGLETEISRLQDLVKDKPHDVELHFQLGNLYFRKGDQRRAIQEYKKALELNPKFVPALNNLALVSAANKEYDKALTIFSDVLNYTPDDVETHYNIACMYSRLRRVDESIEWLQKAIDRGYTNWENIKNDSDLENIRDTDVYKELVKGH